MTRFFGEINLRAVARANMSHQFQFPQGESDFANGPPTSPPGRYRQVTVLDFSPAHAFWNHV